MDAGGKWLLLLNGNGNFQVSVNGGSIVGSTLLTDNQWHHIAVVLSNDGSTDISEAKLYVDGHVEPISASSSCSVSTGSIQNVQIGLCQVQAAYRYFQGLIDDVRIFDYALSSEEIYHLLYPANAWNPSPANGSRFTNVTSGLYWSAGEEAISHDVYFGTSESTVTNAQRLIGDINGDGPVNIKDLSILASQWLTSPGAVSPSADIELNGQVDINDFAAIAAMWGQTPDTVFQGNQIETSFDAGALEYGTTYYWRIDEVNGTDPQSPHKGQVWQFTNTEPTIEIMPLGDSITQGATPGGYRYYLWDKLRNDGYTNINFVGGLTSSDSLDYDKDHEGHWGQNAEYISANINAYLNNNPPDIILLHIGTNGVEDIPVDIVEGILNKIDAFESSTGRNIVVILAKIINRRTDVADPTQVANTTIYNNGLGEMAQARINNGDDIILVDMENGAGFEYTTVDMLDEKHPNTAGNQKMANLWYSALKTILPAK